MDRIYLIAVERGEPYRLHPIRIMRRLRSELRDDMALVLADPPIDRNFYDTENDIEWLILASRFQGTSIFPVVSEWPLDVYVCLLPGGKLPEGDFIDSKDLAILDWAEITNETRT